MDVLSQPQAEPTQGSFPRAGWAAEAEELPTDKGQVSNQDSQEHPWSQVGASPGGWRPVILLLLLTQPLRTSHQTKSPCGIHGSIMRLHRSGEEFALCQGVGELYTYHLI